MEKTLLLKPEHNIKFENISQKVFKNHFLMFQNPVCSKSFQNQVFLNQVYTIILLKVWFSIEIRTSNR